MRQNIKDSIIERSIKKGYTQEKDYAYEAKIYVYRLYHTINGVKYYITTSMTPFKLK